MILESIYEPTFYDVSHGFRPGKSCHTALVKIQKTFTGARWFVEGDIQACFDSFDHHVLIDILRRRIKDEAFIGLMWKFLKAGYMEQWKYHKTYTGTPQQITCKIENATPQVDMPLNYGRGAVCRGVFTRCKGRGCKKVFEIKIETK